MLSIALVGNPIDKFWTNKPFFFLKGKRKIHTTFPPLVAFASSAQTLQTPLAFTLMSPEGDVILLVNDFQVTWSRSDLVDMVWMYGVTQINH